MTVADNENVVQLVAYLPPSLKDLNAYLKSIGCPRIVRYEYQEVPSECHIVTSEKSDE